MTNQVNQEFMDFYNENKHLYTDTSPYGIMLTTFQAATKASESEINSLKERVAVLEADLELLKPHPKCDMGCMLACNTEGNAITELTTSNNQLREAGQALVDRWHTPNWSDETHTRDYIHALEKALSSTSPQSLAEHEIIKSQRDKLLSSLKLALIEMMALPRSLGLEITHTMDMELLIKEVEESK